MTASPRSASVGNADQRVLQQLLRLVLHAEIDGDVDWAALFELAANERVAAIAWQRAGNRIRASAPTSVTADWRALAMRVALQVEALLGAVDVGVRKLRDAGVDVVVLKGAPLAQLLYGDGLVRPLADCDLFVPLAQRRLAAEVLAQEGWTSRTGEPPAEETFERVSAGQRNVIEMHSSAIDDALLAHISIPVHARDVSVGSISLPAFTGEYLPAFLAAHIAKHEIATLLWVFDLYTLWSSLDEPSRLRARACAREVGLDRHLEWGIRLASDFAAGADGDMAALARLRALRSPTGDWGRVRRLAALSATPRDAALVLIGRLWPLEWRDGWRSMPRYVLRRGAGWIARHLQLVGMRRASSTTRAVAVDDSELTSLLQDTLARGLAIWLHPRGTSMQPAIPPSAAARVVPLESRQPRPDDIVLARLPHGPLVLHRIQQISGDAIQLKGDAMRRRDDLVTRSAILGVCDQIEIDGVVYRAEERPRDPVALLTMEARTRLRRLAGARQA